MPPTSWCECSPCANSSSPATSAEGKAYLTVALGCTGGKHRSVALVEELLRRLSGCLSPHPSAAPRHRKGVKRSPPRQGPSRRVLSVATGRPGAPVRSGGLRLTGLPAHRSHRGGGKRSPMNAQGDAVAATRNVTAHAGTEDTQAPGLSPRPLPQVLLADPRDGLPACAEGGDVDRLLGGHPGAFLRHDRLGGLGSGVRHLDAAAAMLTLN